ncbi:hypothetical protein M0804_013795 [Polistes exclamans]|nr:hypothetical protein M0804_013795 [Polistes exclamans]
MPRSSSALGEAERVVRRFDLIKKGFAQFQELLSEIVRTSSLDIKRLKIRISKLDKDLTTLEEIVEKTSEEAIGTLVDEINIHSSAALDAKAEAE